MLSISRAIFTCYHFTLRELHLAYLKLTVDTRLQSFTIFLMKFNELLLKLFYLLIFFLPVIQILRKHVLKQGNNAAWAFFSKE